MRIAVKLAEAIKTLFVAIAVIIIMAAAACFIFELRPAIVVSGSMEPEIGTGSVVIVNQRETEYCVGDVIAFAVGGAHITHRISRIDENGLFHTKGDAVEKEDSWSLPEDDIMGKVIFHMPGVGFALKYCTSIPGMVAIICLILSVFLVGALDSRKT